ncbi:MAG: response regulator [Bacteroidia bacterium]
MIKINKVFLIDDEAVFNMIHNKIMQKLNFAEHTKTYLNANEAIRDIKDALESHPDDLPDAIFIDINMPAMNGWEFLEALEKIANPLVSNCRVYLLSSSIDSKDIEKSKSYKMLNGFISKPLSPQKLEIIGSQPHDNFSLMLH